MNKSPHTLRGSFSAVSTPIFASKYSLESSWRDLTDLHTFAPLRSQNFSQKSSTFFREWILNFRFCFIFYVEFCIFSANFLWNFVRISRQIPEKSDVCRFCNRIWESKLENCRKFWNLWKLFNIIHYIASFVSLVGAKRDEIVKVDPTSESGV